MQQRQYQQDAIKSIVTNWSRNNNTLLVADTGTGKTYMSVQSIEQSISQWDSVLVIVPKRDLLYQWKKTLEKQGLNTGIVGDGRKEFGQVTVATVQSLVNMTLSPTYLILDEVHKYLSPVAMETVKRIAARSSHILGMTATPILPDDYPSLATYFNKVIDLRKRRKELIRNQWFTPPKVVYRQSDCLDQTYKLWKTMASNRKTICFVKSKLDAMKAANYFKNKGESALYVHGGMNKRQRELAEHADIVFNVKMYVEGTDVDGVSCVMILGDDKSDNDFIQKVGRATRPNNGFDEALVLHVNPKYKHPLVQGGKILR